MFGAKSKLTKYQNKRLREIGRGYRRESDEYIDWVHTEDTSRRVGQKGNIIFHRQDRDFRRRIFLPENKDGFSDNRAYDPRFQLGMAIEGLLFEGKVWSRRISDDVILYRQLDHNGNMVFIRFGDIKKAILDMKREKGLCAKVKFDKEQDKYVPDED